MKAIVVAGSMALLVSGCVAHAKPFQGHLSIWPEAEVFTPCGSNEPLWLDYDTKTREPMAKQHWELQKTPYGTTFAVIEGEVGPTLDCGFCEEYKGSFKVHRMLEQRMSGPRDCTP
jgi:hypothetical protein